MSGGTRKLLGMAAILAWILAWSVLIATLADRVTGIHWALTAFFFIVAGIAWIAPLKPLLRWMETGKWRVPQG